MTDLINIMIESRNGKVMADCNNKFNEVLDAVLATGGEGVLTIKLYIRPYKMAMGGGVAEVETEHECKIKKPELNVGNAVFYVAKDGSLSRNDPDQGEMIYEPEPQKGNNPQ